MWFIVFSSTGKDASDDFDDVGHSKSAKEMLQGFYIGEIDVSTIPKNTTYVAPKQPAYHHDKSMEFFIRILQVLVPIAILALALAVRFYTKTSE